jgi:hypothetical protein
MAGPQLEESVQQPEVEEAYKPNSSTKGMTPAAKAARKHIMDLAKKNRRDFGSQRMDIDDFPSKYDRKTQAAAKALNTYQYSVEDAKCGEGQYWCNTDQKCKPIPDGMKTDEDGMLVKEEKNCGCGQDPCVTYGKVDEAEATMCGRCGTKHVAPEQGGYCPALSKAENEKRQPKKEEVEQVEEKTLTPAETKKKEEIAKAIERDNPDMPMDKKMAIATATAKKVTESTISERTKAVLQRAINRNT